MIIFILFGVKIDAKNLANLVKISELEQLTF